MKNEATLIGFKVLLNSRGTLVTEYTELPADAVETVFRGGGDQADVRAILREVSKKLKPLHNEIEQLLLER